MNFRNIDEISKVETFKKAFKSPDIATEFVNLALLPDKIEPLESIIIPI